MEIYLVEAEVTIPYNLKPKSSFFINWQVLKIIFGSFRSNLFSLTTCPGNLVNASAMKDLHYEWYLEIQGEGNLKEFSNITSSVNLELLELLYDYSFVKLLRKLRKRARFSTN